MSEDVPKSASGRVETTVLGFPRIGRDRQLKRALEAYWRGEIDEAKLANLAQTARAHALLPAAAAGLDTVPSGDQALYDHVLDTALMLGAVPPRFAHFDPGADLEFAMARGGRGAAPLELTKWFDTNYHHLVPEIGRRARFVLDPSRQLAHLSEALAIGARARPVVLGPYSFLRLAKPADPGTDPLEHLDALVPLYAELVALLVDAGAEEVQLDEPCLCLDVERGHRIPVQHAMRRLCEQEDRITLATYYGGVEDHLRWLLDLPLRRLHLDLVRSPGQIIGALSDRARAGGLSLGLVDGRNVWRTDLGAAARLGRAAIAALGPERVTLATSCSLVHVPYRASRETRLEQTLRSALAFSDEKVHELVLLQRALMATPAEAEELLAPAQEAVRCWRESRPRADASRQTWLRREAARAPRRPPFHERYRRQMAELGLPDLPATTIGSFPQTDELRKARRRRRAGEIGAAQYEAVVADAIRQAIARQERLGLDVLVHGEPERNDMVEYFAEHLTGFAVTRHGWVQSYGSRCVKPPIIYGDVERPTPITVRWWRLAQDATPRPVKAMLTGPATLLKWSFAREDLPREAIARQIAVALRDEVRDLERAGARIVQVDEPALREGLPLRARDRADYLRWAVEVFRLATSAVGDTTQVHTHMCYADLAEIAEAIARLDVDVLSLETARSALAPLDAIGSAYPGAIGVGVYDVHSPRVPTAEAIEQLLAVAEKRIGHERVWVNPDCGLKTRTWGEVDAALGNLVEATERRRASVATHSGRAG
jgi:5-methyltetrahydropteroyltriglutamate--homocysteine methyltransferase